MVYFVLRHSYFRLSLSVFFFFWVSGNLTEKTTYFAGNVTLRQKLLELLPSRSSQEIKLVRQSYAAIYNKDILHALSNIRRKDPFAVRMFLATI